MINPIKCSSCNAELQPENLLVGTSDKGELTRKCSFCGAEEDVKLKEKKE